jgi:hypothetical protein
MNGQIILKPQEVYNLYLGTSTLEEAGLMLGVRGNTVARFLRKHGYYVMDGGERKSKRKIPYVLSDKETELIIGGLLGDSCISLSGHEGKWSDFKFSLTSIHKEYLNWYVDNIPSIRWRYGNVSIHSQTNQYFTYLRHKWYPNGKKIIPKDLSLTSDIVKHWYLQDGHLDVMNRRVQLCTNGFTFEDCEFLASLLSDFNPTILHQNPNSSINWMIYLSASKVNSFLNYIGDCPVDCFKYKWDVKPYSDKYWNITEINTLSSGYDSRMSGKEIALLVNKSIYAVQKKASRSKISNSYWSNDDIDILKSCVRQNKNCRETATILRKEYEAVMNKANKMGLFFRRWNKEDEILFVNLYQSRVDIHEISKVFNRTVNALHSKAQRMKLRRHNEKF